MKSIRKKLIIIFIAISVINIGLIILQAIVHPTTWLYETGMMYYWKFAIPLAIIQILNIVLLRRILKKHLDSDKKTFIKKLIIPIIIIIVTFFVPIHKEQYDKQLDVEPTEENTITINDIPYTYDHLKTVTVKNIYEITIHKEERKHISAFDVMY